MSFDYDLEACLIHNPQPGFTADDIDAVLAVWEGQNDGDAWRWVLALKGGRYAVLRGWCDYTGWDCQSGAQSWIADDPFKAMSEPHAEIKEVLMSLASQVAHGKNQMWREQKDAEFGVDSSNTINPLDVNHPFTE